MSHCRYIFRYGHPSISSFVTFCFPIMIARDTRQSSSSVVHFRQAWPGEQVSGYNGTATGSSLRSFSPSPLFYPRPFNDGMIARTSRNPPRNRRQSHMWSPRCESTSRCARRSVEPCKLYVTRAFRARASRPVVSFSVKSGCPILISPRYWTRSSW